ncbi:MAG: hypothetical protein J5I62_01520 [Flavobacteriales bacterium]|jgi:hypothetical protein|nr:hypothetical protein [Flavobacteriales bacterium]MEB2341948.1 nucleotidyltransferase domain-containing protein [Flavobacteriia bacterium]
MHVPHAKFRAFGSRVPVTACKFSDLDLAIEDTKELSPRTMGDLRHTFSESDLPILMGLIAMRSVRMPFKRIITEQRVPIV